MSRPLRLSEKIIASHATDVGKHHVRVKPARVALQDASAQMALLQFMSVGKDSVQVPASVHCDHLIVANSGAEEDVQQSIKENKEVFDFLQSASRRYGLDFWGPGSGIIHQIVLENYATPGSLMLGCDSHTPNAGGLSCLAIGVGGADAVEVMAGGHYELPLPRVMGVELRGSLGPWASAKDVILELSGRLTVNGGTGYIIEYFGDGIESLTATDRSTITNMGAEVGATTSIFPYSRAHTGSYLAATNRTVPANATLLKPDDGVEYDHHVLIDLSSLRPKLNGPHTPDRSRFIGKDVLDGAEEVGAPRKISAALIGSCTNSSYHDMTAAASIVSQATAAGLKPKVDEFVITPGSEQIRATLERDGVLQTFRDAGAKVMANACGPCIGQWKRSGDADPDNTIVSSFNRNFVGRNDGNATTYSFLASPEMTAAMAYAGDISFDPSTDTIDGNFRFKAPQGTMFPPSDFTAGESRLEKAIESLEERKKVAVEISPNSQRLQILEAFAPWNGNCQMDLNVLVKAHGKCTTDHISPAGPWLKYKGHLENISNCTLIGVDKTVPDRARALGKPWAVVAEHNYGEGSAREHAALQPRYLGCQAVIAKSFARIHEKNLTRVGIMPLTFVEESDFDLIEEGAEISLQNVDQIQPGANVQAVLCSNDSCVPIQLKHSMNEQQIKWFKAGSALNALQ